MVNIPRATLIIIVALLVVALAPAAGVHAQGDIPANDGWVTDLGGFLTPQQERSLETLMESYRQGSGHEIALLTVPDLGGRALESYALDVARKWGLGEKDKNNGALLLITRAERKVRIEVGRGLEGTITDAISGRIIRGIISPEFKKGNFYAGISGGIVAVHEAAGGEYARIPEERRRKSGGGIGLFPFIFIFFILSSLFRRRRGGGGRGGRGGGLLTGLFLGSMLSGGGRSSGGGFSSGGSFGGFGGGGGFSGGGSSGGW